MKILDLFCGAGGAAMGLSRVWPEATITGVDIKPQLRYPFEFVLGDAMTFPLEGYDFIWASPPCQRYSHVTPNTCRDNHPDLIQPIRARLLRYNFVIENVPGARHLLRNPQMLCGSMFGLRSRRHRWFETSFNWNVDLNCDHREPPLLVTTAGANSRAIRQPGQYKSVYNAPVAYGIDWMDFQGLKEAIPPAYSEYIARQFQLSQLKAA